MNPIIRLDIMMGLPGSGKSYYVNNTYARQRSYNFINLDWFAPEEREEKLKNRFNYYGGYIAIDGLILTKEDIRKILEVYNPRIDRLTRILIHKWEEDRETCLSNDLFRVERDLTSQRLIENAPFDNDLKDEDIEPMTNSENIVIVSHKVHKVTPLEAKINYYKSSNDKFMESEEWCLGGKWANCWGTQGDIDPDPVPSSFEKLDELLKEISPDLPFPLYHKLYSECVTIEYREDVGYYGDWSEYNHYQCDTEKLVKFIEDNNIKVSI